jgi:cobalt-zinc-cadmium efflux system outer membrane protein
MNHRLSLFLFLSFLSCQILRAQVKTDTLTISLPDAEKIFFEKNLTLLAGKYNIDANKALIEQAKLWDNPFLITDQNIYADNKWFAHGKDVNGNPEGQFFIQVQQLIKTAGKRGKLIDLATTNAKLSELQFNDLLRNLKFQFRSDYFTITQLTNNHNVYEREAVELRRLVAGMEQQLQAGNIAQKDFIRVQALLLSMQQDMLTNDRQLQDVQTEMRTLLQMTDLTFIKPTVPDSLLTLPSLVVDTLVNTARVYNSAYLIQQQELLYQQQNLTYQKALRSPDLTLGPEYDHNSNYAPNYVGLSISLPLPVFNRNQGNIKSAQYSVKQQETVLQQSETILNNNVKNAYQKLLLTYEHSRTAPVDFYRRYDNLISNVVESYRARQLSLLEFIDLFEAYKDTQTRLQQQLLNLRLAKEELNFETGTDVVK